MEDKIGIINSIGEVCLEEIKYMMYGNNEFGRDIHYFNLDEDVVKLLELTNFNESSLSNLPFLSIRLNFKYNDKYGFFYPYLYVHEDGCGKITICYFRIDKDGFCSIGILDNSPKRDNVGVYDRDKFYKVMQTSSRNPIEEYNAMLDSEKLVYRFVGNFLNLLKIKDIEYYTIERTPERNLKRIKRGKLPIPKTIILRIKGDLLKYVNHLRKNNYINYSHSFWVRGHWRVLKDINVYKENVGKTLWIYPYIKGQGVLVKKDYIVEKSQDNNP